MANSVVLSPVNPNAKIRADWAQGSPLLIGIVMRLLTSTYSSVTQWGSLSCDVYYLSQFDPAHTFRIFPTLALSYLISLDGDVGNSRVSLFVPVSRRATFLFGVALHDASTLFEFLQGVYLVCITDKGGLHILTPLISFHHQYMQ